MRRTTFVAVALITLGISVMVPQHAYAVANVLVPSDDNGGSSSMGSSSDNANSDVLLPSTPGLAVPAPMLSPSPTLPTLPSGPSQLSSGTTATVNGAVGSTEAIAKALDLVKKAPSDPKLLDPTGANTISDDQMQQLQAAMKTVGAPQAGLIKPSDIMYSPVTDAEAANLPLGSVRTTIVRGMDMAPLLAQVGKGLPYALTMSIGPKSVFGSKDVQTIQDKLGMSRDEIGQSCILTLSGMLQTDKGSYMIASGATPQVTVRYDGMIKDYMMLGMAKCAYSGKLPPGSGFLTLIDGRFNIGLSLVKCDPPNRQVSELVVTYDGTPKSRCQYQ